MNFYKDFVKDTKEFTDYEDFKANFELKIPSNFNFARDVVDRYADTVPSKLALVWCDDSGESHYFTFKEISQKSKQTAAFLSANGIQKGDTVMLILRRRYEFWFFLLALHRLGAIAVPATNQLLQKDIEYRTQAAGIKMIVSYDDDEVLQRIQSAAQNSPCVEKLVTTGKPKTGWISYSEEIQKYSPDFESLSGKETTQNTDTMLVYFTSGTSGQPKMVQHNFIYPLAHIVTARYWQRVTDGGLHLTVAETGWAKAMWGKIYGQWICGSAVMVYDMASFSPSRTIDVIAKYRVTTFCAPPTTYRFMVRADIKKYDLSALKHITTAGEALPEELFDKVYEATGLKMSEAFGQTETTVLTGNFPGMLIKQGSMGKPSPLYDLEIVRDDGTKCEANEEGSIVIHLKQGGQSAFPAGLFQGYYKNAEQTQKAFMNGDYYTGDRAYYDKDGYLWFIGRNDDVIKTSGYRVSPFEIESILLLHPCVSECAVIGVPDEKRGQAIKAVIVLKKDFEPTKELKLQIFEFMKEKTAAYKHPRIIEFVSELPKTISGKIQHAKLRER